MELVKGFYCPSIKRTDVGACGKLRYVMGCLWCTRNLPVIASIDDKGDVCAHTDGAHAAHTHGKGHYELFVIMDRGDMIKFSKKLGVLLSFQ